MPCLYYGRNLRSVLVPMSRLITTQMRCCWIVTSPLPYPCPKSKSPQQGGERLGIRIILAGKRQQVQTEKLNVVGLQFLPETITTAKINLVDRASFHYRDIIISSTHDFEHYLPTIVPAAILGGRSYLGRRGRS